MKKSKFSEEQITLALHTAESGTASVNEVCRKLGITDATFYRWKSKYGNLMPSELKRMKQLEEENKKLKSLVADLSLDKHMLQEVIAKKY
jgi:putative transposase